ncbi:MAG TPA: hypothetical protein VET46_02200 [Steroidobacteraceae bacterium]|nr:hypothetical protein [Steroidobacteraceae bacterium]
MSSAVIVIADLYLQSGESRAQESPAAPGMPALEFVGRFGERSHVEGGWRRWLARSLGRGDLAAAPLAAVAAAGLTSDAGAAATRWIATPVELIAGLTRLHLSRRGILRLSAAEQAELAAAFHRAFAGADLELRPLGDGQLLLYTPQIGALETAEPARCAGGDIQVPQGPAASPLLRLLAEIEMWLHGEPINEARRMRGLPPVTGLWLWGAAGELMPARDARDPAAHGGGRTPLLACGSDAWLMGLCALHGGVALPLPESPAAILAERLAECAVLVAETAGEAPQGEDWSLQDAVAAIDRRLVGPALEALDSGTLERLTVIANDTRISVGRHSALRRWRRRRSGFRVFT